jgi:hypothetical protein
VTVVAAGRSICCLKINAVEGKLWFEWFLGI